MSEVPTTLSGVLPSSWLRAIAFATSVPEGREALAGVLGEAVGAARGAAGAVLERRGSGCRAVWGVEEGSVLPLLQEGGAIHAAMTHHEELPEEALLLQRGLCAGRWVGDFDKAMLLPLRARGFAVGALALFYPPDAAPQLEDRDAAALLAGVLALLVENERLFDEAHEAREAREHFVTALNHELRTPATALMLDADLLRSGAFGDLPPRLAKVLRETEEHVQELTRVLRRVMDLGSGGRAAPERADVFQPRVVVADLLRRIEPVAKRKNLTISLYVPRNLPTLQTDVTRVSRILLHLFSNAIKYTSHGGVEVRLERTTRVLRRHKAEPVLTVRVRDTGRGIPPEQLSRIFQPFAQVEEGARTDSRQRGIGLGLPLAQQLAQSLGGEITIESTPGDGTTAMLTLPYYQPTSA